MSGAATILVVDDESAILDTIRILLKNEGFQVTTAQGGRRASTRSRAASSTWC